MKQTLFQDYYTARTLESLPDIGRLVPVYDSSGVKVTRSKLWRRILPSVCRSGKTRYCATRQARAKVTGPCLHGTEITGKSTVPPDGRAKRKPSPPMDGPD